MSDNFQSAMLEILKSVQTSIVELRADIAGLRTEIADIKELARKQRRDTAGILVMMKGVTGVFDERVTGLETRVTLLEQERQS
jgi:uncharacterized small protein (DUF1192 family)